MPRHRATINIASHRKTWLGIAGCIVLLDQLSKMSCRNWLTPFTHHEIVPGFFRLALHYNSGAAFSFLAHEAGWQIYLFAILAIAIATWFIWGIWQGRFIGGACIGATCILGGAIGNLIDRCYYGYVTDFLVFYYQSHYFPAFNIADSAITIGACWLLLSRQKNIFCLS